MPNNIQTALDQPSAYRVSKEEADKAALIVCANAVDAEEAALFLEELGLK